MSPLQGRKFAHEPVYCKQRGRIKVYCRCGQQSKGKFEEMKDAAKAYSLHIGIKEIERKGLILH